MEKKWGITGIRKVWSTFRCSTGWGSVATLVLEDEYGNTWRSPAIDWAGNADRDHGDYVVAEEVLQRLDRLIDLDKIEEVDGDAWDLPVHPVFKDNPYCVYEDAIRARDAREKSRARVYAARAREIKAYDLPKIS